MTCARLETNSWPSTSTPKPREFGHFLEEGDRVENHAVADDALASLAQHAAGNELQHELLPADDDGVPGVVPARVACHGAEALAQHVHNFALALVAPLGAQHYRRLRSHLFLRFRRSFAQVPAAIQTRKMAHRSRRSRQSGYAGESLRAHRDGIQSGATFDSKPCHVIAL